MKNVKKLLGSFLALFLLSFIALPMAAFADPVQVSVELVGVGGASNGAYYIAPYYLSVSSVSGDPQVSAFCVDFNDWSKFYVPWTANVTSVSGLSFGNTYQGNQLPYLEMGYLASIYNSNPLYQVYIQQAIWDISTKLGFLSSPYSDGYNISSMATTWYWYNQATQASNYNNWITSGWIILSDTATTGKEQEFLVKTPEPSCLLLLGMGLVGVYGFTRRRIKSDSSAS